MIVSKNVSTHRVPSCALVVMALKLIAMERAVLVCICLSDL